MSIGSNIDYNRGVNIGDKRVFEIIKNAGGDGRTITEIVSMSHLPRSVVRITLARLEGADKIKFRKVGMAKVYSAID